MVTLFRAVVTGFGLSLGKLIFDKLKERYVDPLFPESTSESEPVPADVEIVDSIAEDPAEA